MPIEFLDEDAPDPPRTDPPARRTLLLRVAAAVAVAAAVVAWALTRPDGGATTAAPKPTTAPKASVRPSPPQLAPTVVRCGSGGPVTTELASAMEHFLPTLKIDNLRVYRCVRGSGPNGRVVFEAVSSRYRGMNIDVEAALRGVETPGTSPQLGAEGGRYVVRARIDTIAAGLEVSVIDWARPDDHRRPPADALRKLADFVSLNVIL